MPRAHFIPEAGWSIARKKGYTATYDTARCHADIGHAPPRSMRGWCSTTPCDFVSLCRTASAFLSPSTARRALVVFEFEASSSSSRAKCKFAVSRSSTSMRRRAASPPPTPLFFLYLFLCGRLILAPLWYVSLDFFVFFAVFL